jgi:4-hydroxybenzoate polyprenyltransferase
MWSRGEVRSVSTTSEEQTVQANGLSLSAVEARSAQAAPWVPPRRSFFGQFPAAVRAMRPKQWTKNGLVLLALVFARRLTDVPSVERAVLAFFAFSLTASTIYIVNDIADREKDRLHPRKRYRPIASGQLSLPFAGGTALLCTAGAVALTYLLVTNLTGLKDPFLKWGGSPLLFSGTLAIYAVMNVAYSTWLKHQVLWDVFIIAAGFVLRALAGAFAIPVPISPWFYLCTTFLALFLALGKRRAELVLLSADASGHRRNLREYTLQLLDQLMVVVVTCTLMSYSLYTFQTENTSHALMLTIPFVVFGLFRYLYLIYVKGDGDQPDELLWRDKQILGVVILCVLVVAGVLYGLPLIQH